MGFVAPREVPIQQLIPGRLPMTDLRTTLQMVADLTTPRTLPSRIRTAPYPPQPPTLLSTSSLPLTAADGLG
jgi:hypothetical protein